jgi:hypothetical protein
MWGAKSLTRISGTHSINGKSFVEECSGGLATNYRYLSLNGIEKSTIL